MSPSLIVVTGDDAKTMVGVGPLLVMPTATDDALGAQSTWQAGAMVNAFVEPQMSVYHHGTGLPSFQVFFGLNLQFPHKN